MYSSHSTLLAGAPFPILLPVDLKDGWLAQHRVNNIMELELLHETAHGGSVPEKKMHRNLNRK